MFTKTIVTGAAVAGILMTGVSTALAVSPMDKQFATKAAQGGLFEVKSSQIALAKTHNTRVRNVARRMVKEHSAANAELMTVAQNKKMMLPKETDPKHQAIISKLSGLSGTAFDKAYIASQETAHADTIKLFEKEIALGKDGGYTAFAAKNLPTIEDHTKMIFQVGSGLGVHATTMPVLKPAMMPSDMSGKNM
jgi:putative membrane protein